MKESNNNAVDLLLRSLARGERNGAARGEGAGLGAGRTENQGASNHLDADELNLFAEGVIPDPARARYTQHLADCGRCRGLIVGLAQAAGTTARHAPMARQSGVGFWQKFGALFSLPVLRYGLPALMLTGVIAVGLLALRDERQPNLVARNEPVDSSGGLNRTQPSDNPTGSSSEATPPLAPRPEASKPGENTAVLGPKNNPDERNDGLMAKTTDANAAKPISPGLYDSRDSSQGAGVVSSQPSYAPEPAPPPKIALKDAETKSMIAKDKILEREASQRNEETFRSANRDDSPTHGPARSRAGSVARGRNADEDRAATGKDKKEVAEQVETRTVSGRHFIRQGHAWIDSVFESGRAVTSVARGSDQFRALIADEPGLRAIVQQLGGEVVVVWKNRAYRFR